MAVLRGKAGTLDFMLRPYKISDEGEPTWILVQLELDKDGAELLSTTVSLTRDDLVELATLLNEVADNRRTDFSMATTDDDFIVTVQRMSFPEDVSVGFWVGEPYELMKGFRFVVAAEAVKQFARDLHLEEQAVLPRSPLP